jgi:hypothetical protein
VVADRSHSAPIAWCACLDPMPLSVGDHALGCSFDRLEVVRSFPRGRARSPIMGESVAVRSDQVALGVLVAAVLREVARRRRGELRDGAKRSDGKLPTPVMTSLTMAMCLFAQGDYIGSRGGVAGTRTGPAPTASVGHSGRQAAGSQRHWSRCARADELAAAYHQRWEGTSNDQLKTHLREPGKLLRSRLPELAH